MDNVSFQDPMQDITLHLVGKDEEERECGSNDVTSRETLPSSSEEKTPRSVTHEVLKNADSSEKVNLSVQNFQHSNYDDFFKDASESESESIFAPGSSFLRDKWSSEDEELAGPSQTIHSPLSDSLQIVSERELAQLAQVRPLLVNFHEQSVIRDYFKVLEKKVAEYEILQEFLVNILVLTKVYM
ncbi:tyrosine-protein phosphatase non-receptor type 20-like [Ursus americanus]|uniref:tyrosine-protein phosphatase non-receptor type 20-like n=1 Tax=Ursus americanus TaxID=9643 RepID=UPI001E67984D|nr:tyrosine-protein phosphatase non-receptor type 20-like [Ursus americanus]